MKDEPKRYGKPINLRNPKNLINQMIKLLDLAVKFLLLPFAPLVQ